MTRDIWIAASLSILAIALYCSPALAGLAYSDSPGFAVDLSPATGNAYSMSDSGAFSVDLRPTNLGNPYSSSDSATFVLDLRRLNSGYADSASFAVAAIPAGDIDRDGHVDVIDLLWLVYAFGSRMGDENYSPAADLYPCPVDGEVDVVDLLVLVANFGVY